MSQTFLKKWGWKNQCDKFLTFWLLMNNPTIKSAADKWILNRAAVAITDTNTAFNDYAFQQCTTAIYNFWLYDLCDVYLEATKRVFYKVLIILIGCFWDDFSSRRSKLGLVNYYVYYPEVKLKYARMFQWFTAWNLYFGSIRLNVT